MSRAERRRVELGLRKEDVTGAVGVLPSTYSKWLKGRPRLTADQIVGICEILKMDPSKAAFGPASTPSSAASPLPALQPDISALTHLHGEELRAFLAWLLKQVKTMPKERPLTIACRKIATRLAHETGLPQSPEKSAQVRSAKGTAGKDVASEVAPAPQASHPQSKDHPKA